LKKSLSDVLVKGIDANVSNTPFASANNFSTQASWMKASRGKAIALAKSPR